MKHSQFMELMREEFGESYSEILLRDLVLQDLEDLTASSALRNGFSPKEVWLAICRTEQVPENRRHGFPLKKK